MLYWPFTKFPDFSLILRNYCFPQIFLWPWQPCMWSTQWSKSRGHSHQGQRVSFLYKSFIPCMDHISLMRRRLNGFLLLQHKNLHCRFYSLIDFSIKAQALLQTINLKSLQAKAQLKKLVVLTLHCCSFITTAYWEQLIWEVPFISTQQNTSYNVFLYTLHFIISK